METIRETIREALDDDRPAIHAILRGADLPVPAPHDPPVDFVVAEIDGAVVGSCGWEAHAGHALVRSVAIAPAFRGRGVGARLVGEALRRVAALRPATVTLVTMDANGFFAKSGFASIDREEVPEPIRASPEWSAHRCLGGHWMRLRE